MRRFDLTEESTMAWGEPCTNCVMWEIGAGEYVEFKEVQEKIRPILEAVAHIGVDFGYGEYVLEDKFIEQARELLKCL